MSEIKVGDKLWFQTTRRYEACRYVTVDAVGRKWLALGNGYRADKNTLVVDSDGYASHASLHVSQEAYEAERDLHDRWRLIRAAVSGAYRPPAGVTLGDLKTAMELLRLA